MPAITISREIGSLGDTIAEQAARRLGYVLVDKYVIGKIFSQFGFIDFKLGVEVAIRRKLAIIHFDQSTQVYFLVERVGGEFGSGSGEEYTDADPNDPEEGIYTDLDADR